MLHALGQVAHITQIDAEPESTRFAVGIRFVGFKDGDGALLERYIFEQLIPAGMD